MERLVIIFYNQAIDNQVMELLEGLNLKNYTKIIGALGRGESSGLHLGNDIWPGRNNLLMVGCLEKEAKYLLTQIREARKKVSQEGLKAFVLKIEDFS